MISEITEFTKNNRHEIKIGLWITGIILAMNMQKIKHKIPINIRNIVSHKIFRLAVMFMVIYSYTTSVYKSAIVALSIFFASYLIDVMDLKETFNNFCKKQ